MAESGRRWKLKRVAKRVGNWLAIVCSAYLLILLFGLLPVNNGFAPTPLGVEIFVSSNAVHADIIVPKDNDVVSWSNEFSEISFVGDVNAETHVAFGWGDRGFFLETPTWNDLKISTAAKALLLPSSSCVHVSFTRPGYFSDLASVAISQAQYRELVQFIKETLKHDSQGKYLPIPGYAYSSTDVFFDAHGSYHLFNTCNSWVGRGLRKAGVRVPWLTSMPRTPMLYLREAEVAR